MHPANRLMWKTVEEKYEKHFHGPNAVVECGSHNINGTVREHFKGFTEYIGIDWRAGNCVDYVSLIHELPWENRFDTLISSSCLEHDPYWVETLKKMVELLKPDGAMFLSWGAMLNVPHCHDTAPDCEFHPLSPKKVMFVLEKLGMYIHEFGYESRFAKLVTENLQSGGDGEVYLVAFKNKKLAVGEASIEAFLEADDIDMTSQELERFDTTSKKEEIEGI